MLGGTSIKNILYWEKNTNKETINRNGTTTMMMMTSGSIREKRDDPALSRIKNRTVTIPPPTMVSTRTLIKWEQTRIKYNKGIRIRSHKYWNKKQVHYDNN